MRPALLTPLFASLTTLDKIGPKVAALIRKVVPADLSDREARIADLLFLAPSSVIDRRKRSRIMDTPEGALATLELTIDRHQPPPRGNRSVPYRVFAFDQSGEIALSFFHGNTIWLEKQFPVGVEMLVSGKIEWFNGRASMVHPDHAVPMTESHRLPAVEIVYPGTGGLSGKVLRNAVEQSLRAIPELPEWLDDDIAQKHSFPSFRKAMQRLHTPSDPLDAVPEGAAWRRLAYDELLAGQVALALVRNKVRKVAGAPLMGDGHVVHAIQDALPYKLTDAQTLAVEEIHADLAKPERMLRLLQGDVGSGKTVVALLAMARAIEAGGQAALMAPTEILARQHFATILPLAEKAGLRVGILTGRSKATERRAVLEALEVGEIDIAVGTHALFQEGVSFKNLVLSIVDEQHRFGVHQRLAISAKGAAPDMLVMTATPIPRTLVLTAFGDMDVSRLTEKPAGRQPIQTISLSSERIGDLVARLRGALAEGRKAYWICPLVDESEEMDLTSARQRFEDLTFAFPGKVGLIHGRMKGTEKEEAMAAFKEGRTRILVATTVVEVGVDVPDATIIVIEHAERFGLAQLHQLRGRVGRGSDSSTCVLLFEGPLGETSKRRIEVMRETEDGFRIAEEDLKLRGQGDVLGTKQSGQPGFQMVRLEQHSDLLALARDDARLLLHRDPELKSQRGEAVRLLLYLFGRDDAIRLLRAG
ncbi:ATP-dependent DNA helicase RecG [Limoniibacter endophyticus]|nr:ATP-dependent DNA helicase RecG [Limoniibacter endophyticus]